MGKRTSRETTADMFQHADNETVKPTTVSLAETCIVDDTATVLSNSFSLADEKTYKTKVKKINSALSAVKKSFFDIAFALEWIDSTQAYVYDECDNIESFAKKQFGIGRTSTYNYIHVARRFGERDEKTGEINKLKDCFKSYSPTQLIILYDAGVTDEFLDGQPGINPSLTCTELKNCLKALWTVGNNLPDNDGDNNGGNDNGGNDNSGNNDGKSGIPAKTASASTVPADTEAKPWLVSPSKCNRLLTFKTVEDFDKRKDTVLDTIRKTLSQDGLQCSVSINMEWD